MALAVEENNLICCFSDGDGLFLCLNVTRNDAERKELLRILPLLMMIRRLYCLRFGSATVIIGGGGNKNTRTYQENPKLDKEVKLMSKISEMITSAMKEKDIYLNSNGTFSGNLLLED